VPGGQLASVLGQSSSVSSVTCAGESVDLMFAARRPRRGREGIGMSQTSLNLLDLASGEPAPGH